MSRYRISILILAALFPIFVAGAIGSYRKYAVVLGEFRRQENRFRELTAEESRLRESIEYLSHDVNLEKEARTRFNFIRKGEVMVVIVSPRPSPAPGEASPATGSWWETLVKWFRRD